MAKIPVYTAGRLASEAVGVPRQDQSGEIVAQAVTRLAARAADVIGESVAKQRALLQKSELLKTTSQFDSEMTLATNEIKQKYASDPDEGLKQLRAKRQELFETYKNGLTDQDVKINFDAHGSSYLNQGGVIDSVWAYQMNQSKIQKGLFDRITQDAEFAGNSNNIDEVIGKAQLLDSDREAYYEGWGDVLSGGKVIDQGQESIFRSYFFGQLDKGNAFKVLKELESGKFGATKDQNGLLDVNTINYLKAQATKMAMKDRNDSATFALMGAVQTNFDIDGALKQPVSATEEKINSLSFEIAKKREQVKTGEVSPEEVKTLEEQQKMFGMVREKQLAEESDRIIPDRAVEGEITAKFGALFKDKNPKKSFKGTLEDVFKFQQSLLENRNRISPALFKQYSILTEAAFQSDIQGMTKNSKFKTQQSWFGIPGLTQPEAIDKGRLSTSKKFQNVFSDIIAKHDTKEGNADLFETMRIFYDDLTEILDLKDAPSVEAFSQKALNDLADGAKRKWQLQKMGLPTYLGEKDVVYKNGQAYVITGFQNGRPMVEPR